MKTKKERIEEVSKLLENGKFSLQEKYEVCLKLKQFDRAKKYLLKIKEEKMGGALPGAQPEGCN